MSEVEYETTVLEDIYMTLAFIVGIFALSFYMIIALLPKRVITSILPLVLVLPAFGAFPTKDQVRAYECGKTGVSHGSSCMGGYGYSNASCGKLNYTEEEGKSFDCGVSMSRMEMCSAMSLRRKHCGDEMQLWSEWEKK